MEATEYSRVVQIGKRLRLLKANQAGPRDVPARSGHSCNRTAQIVWLAPIPFHALRAGTSRAPFIQFRLHSGVLRAGTSRAPILPAAPTVPGYPETARCSMANL